MSNTEQNYVPLIINFIPAVTSTSAVGQRPTPIEVINEEYRLLIKNDASNNYSKFNVLPQTVVVTIPNNNIVKLKLFSYRPNLYQEQSVSRYIVEYYTAEGKKLFTQRWRVPSFTLPNRSLKVNYDGTNPVSLPSDLFEIISITPEVEYNISNNQLIPDAVGEYTISYQQGLTLYDVVVNE